MQAFESVTPSLARSERATVYKLGRLLTVTRLLDGGKHEGNAFGAPYGVMDAILIRVMSTTRYDNSGMGLTFSNGA